MFHSIHIGRECYYLILVGYSYVWSQSNAEVPEDRQTVPNPWTRRELGVTVSRFGHRAIRTHGFEHWSTQTNDIKINAIVC